MSLLLVVLAVATAANPVRIAVAAGGDRRAPLLAACVLAPTTIVVAWLSGPINNLIGVSTSSAVIAAGISVVVIGVRDALVSPPRLEPSSTSVPTALFPLFFPTMFTPAVALMALATGAERGVVPAAAAMFVGLAASVGTAIGLPHGFTMHRPTLTRLVAGVFGVGGVIIGSLVATHGVMSI